MQGQGFNTGLCGCCDDVSGCLDHICCPSCMIGRQCAALDGQTNTMNMCCCIAALFSSAALSVWACCIRKKLNEQFNMDVSCLNWCICGCLFPSCSLCQTHRELTIRNRWPGGTCCTSKPYNMN